MNSSLWKWTAMCALAITLSACKNQEHKFSEGSKFSGVWVKESVAQNGNCQNAGETSAFIVQANGEVDIYTTDAQRWGRHAADIHTTTIGTVDENGNLREYREGRVITQILSLDGQGRMIISDSADKYGYGNSGYQNVYIRSDATQVQSLANCRGGFRQDGIGGYDHNDYRHDQQSGQDRLPHHTQQGRNWNGPVGSTNQVQDQDLQDDDTN